MIATLRGTLARKALDHVVAEVGGVGYLVQVSAQTLAALPAEGEAVHLLCHTHVREDAIQIFGFARSEEQQAFELLILVSGIGPRLALTILSGMPVQDLLRAIAEADHGRLVAIPGIGRKTAERMVVELKERCARLSRALAPATPTGAATGTGTTEIVEALVNLGYKRQLAERAVERALAGEGPPPRPEELLRRALVAIREA